jgi:hypothetical protein
MPYPGREKATRTYGKRSLTNEHYAAAAPQGLEARHLPAKRSTGAAMGIEKGRAFLPAPNTHDQLGI